MRKKEPKVDIPRAQNMGFKPSPILNRRLMTAIIILLILFGLGYLFSSIVSSTSNIKFGNIAVIKIRDVIAVDGIRTPFTESSSSEELIELIEVAEFNPEVKAIIFDINSPGGSAVASDEIQKKIKSVNKTTVALVRDIAASGAYWAASAADYVVANQFSIVGSVGVMGSYVEFAGLLERYNMTYRRIVAGEYKDMGNPLKELEYDEERLLQELVDEFHVGFIESVAKNRGLSQDQISKIRTAEIFSGKKALELGLVDMLGSEKDALKLIETELNITSNPVEYKKERTFWQQLRGLIYGNEINLESQVRNLENNGLVVRT